MVVETAAAVFRTQPQALEAFSAASVRADAAHLRSQRVGLDVRVNNALMDVTGRSLKGDGGGSAA